MRIHIMYLSERKSVVEKEERSFLQGENENNVNVGGPQGGDLDAESVGELEATTSAVASPVQRARKRRRTAPRSDSDESDNPTTSDSKEKNIKVSCFSAGHYKL